MRFPVIGATQGLTATPSVSAVSYVPMVFAAQQALGGTNEVVTQIAVSEACTITDLTVNLGVAPGGAASWNVAVRVNGVTSAATVTITGAATSGTISGLSVAVADGDAINLMLTPSGTPAFPSTLSTIAMVETFTSSFFVMGAYLANINTTADNFLPLTGLHGVSALVETTRYACPINGTLDRMRVLCRSTAPGGITGYSLGFRQNGTDTLTCTIVGAATTDIQSGPIAVAVGDLLDLRAQSINSPTARRLSWCLSFTAATAGESFLGVGATVDAGTGNTTNFQPAFGGTSYSTEVGRFQPAPDALVIKKLTVVLTVAPGGVANRTVTMRSNGASTALAVSMTGSTASGQDTTHTATLVSGATWAIQFVSTGTPAAPGAGGVSVGYAISTTQPGPSDSGTITSICVPDGSESLQDEGTCASVAVPSAADAISDTTTTTSVVAGASAEAIADAATATSVVVVAGVDKLADAGTATSVALVAGTEVEADTGTLASVAASAGTESISDTGTIASVASLDFVIPTSPEGTVTGTASLSGVEAILDVGVVGTIAVPASTSTGVGTVTGTAAFTQAEAITDTGAIVSVAVHTSTTSIVDAGQIVSIALLGGTGQIISNEILDPRFTYAGHPAVRDVGRLTGWNGRQVAPSSGRLSLADHR